MIDSVLDKISVFLGQKLTQSKRVGGGCIADSRIIETITGDKYFLKQGFSNGMFRCEANGLIEILKSNSIKTPKVILVDDEFLLLGFVSQGIKSNKALFSFGQSLAQMHKFSGSDFGFYEDNFIGSTRQLNSYANSWSDFYLKNRLEFQYKLAEKNGYATPELKSKFIKIERILPDIIKGSEEPPSLIHGDLWGGNYLIDSQGDAVLIDPAVYYGHREADLAMTKLFGGFSPEFYIGYNETFPLQDDYQYRENIYLLYHVLNHLNLFGHGYYSQAIDLMNFYL